MAALIKQKPYEHIVYVLRRHPITFLPTIFVFLLLLSIPPIVYLMMTNFFPDFFSHQTLLVIGVLLGSSYYFAVSLFFLSQFAAYYLDMWVVTNDRIIDIEQYNLFSRTVAELDLFRIQDATSSTKGFFSTMLHYGNVSIKTASQNQDIVFRTVRSPSTVREDLIRLSHEDRKYHYQQPGTTAN